MSANQTKHRREYDNPPIKERIVEVHLVPGPTSLRTAREALQQRWSARFPIVEPQLVGGFEIKWAPGDMPMQTTAQMSSRLRFWRQDKKRLLQVGRELFAANDLLPEPGWDELAPMFRDGYLEYREIMQPKAVFKAVLRYVNRVPIPNGKSVKDMLSIFPSLPEEAERAHTPFQMVVHMGEQKAGPSVMALAFAALEEGQPTYTLELLVESGRRDLREADALFAWAEEAHVRVTDLFDQSITPAARAEFGERVRR